MNGVVLTDVMKNDEFNAGSKARNDVRDIAVGLGYRTKVVFNRNHNNILKAVELTGALLSMGGSIEDGCDVILQYPYNIKLVKLFTKQMQRLRAKRGCRVIFLLHDVYYLRGDQAESVESLKRDELSCFNQVDALIVHNDVMKARLSRDGVTTPMVSLGFFDYLTDRPCFAQEPHDRVRVDFAGRLSKEKSGFIYDYAPPERIEMNLYGQHDSAIPTAYHYQGSFEPAELVGCLRGDYGLVWDGETSASCVGNFGEYLKYNNPHKASLYLAAGKPIVVWKESALAKAVERMGIGRCVANLNELETLPAYGSAEYAAMAEKVAAVSRQLRDGGMLKRVLREIDGLKRSK